MLEKNDFTKKEKKNMSKLEIKQATELGVYDLLDTDNRFIPDCIKYNSFEIRKEFMESLMSCDGMFLDDTNPPKSSDKKIIFF